MRLLRELLSTDRSREKFGRRIFLSLLLVITLPFCIFAFVSYFELKNILVSQSEALQREKIRDAASLLIDLFEDVDIQLRQLTGESTGSLPAEITEIVDHEFNWSSNITNVNTVLAQALGVRVESVNHIRERVSTGLGALHVNDAHSPPTLNYVTKTHAGIRVATISLDNYLQELSRWAEYFVISSELVTIASSVDVGDTAWVRMLSTEGTSGSFTFDEGDTSWVYQYAMLFLKQQFGSEGLFLVSRVDEAAALQSLIRYKWIFAGSLVLILLLIALLSAVQIRRKVKPMLHLVDAANAIAAKRFNVEFDQELTGELGVLSRTMESMSRQLSVQFQYLKVLNKIDKYTLSDVDTATVAARIVREIRLYFPCNYVGLFFVNQTEDGIAVLVEIDNAQQEPSIKIFDNASAESISSMAFSTDVSNESRNQLARLLRGKDASESRELRLLPLIDEGKAYGALLIKSHLQKSSSKKLNRTLSKLASHVSVALNAKMRERGHRRRALWDSLTGAPNRRYMESQLISAIADAQKQKVSGAVFFLDLDHFKKINDTLGHEFGDELLRLAYSRIASNLPANVMGARFGGDEFVLLVRTFDSESELVSLAEKLIAALAQVFDVRGHLAYVGVSVGIARFPQDGESVDELLRCADLAMYQSKRAGRGQYSLFSRIIDNRFHDRIKMEKSIRRSLENMDFTVRYQPQICTRTGEIVGVEALARWPSKDLGTVGPAKFIPAVEELGLIEELGEWILRKSCRDVLWLKEQSNVMLRLGVNFSSVQFSRPHFDEVIRSTLEECGFPNEKFEVELTESVVMGNFEQVTTTLEKLLSHGVSISIDDFGTGYSSLSYLHKLPVSSVKIDREFIDGVDNDPRKAVTARSIISMNKSLGIRTLAEGVETESERLWLQEEFCDEIQGFYFSKPLSLIELKSYVQTTHNASVDLAALHS